MAHGLIVSQSTCVVHSGGYKIIVYVICTIAALGGLLFGLDQGFIANSLATIEKVYHLDIKGAENYSAILATGGVLGALLSGLFARFLGRKKSLVFAGFIFSAASIISALLPPLLVLSLCRFCLGFAVGISSFVVPLYLSETAPPSIRGSMGTLFQLMITIGIFLISLTNVFIARIIINPITALPLMFLVIAIFSLMMFFGAFVLPESPRWLMLKGRRENAKVALTRIFNTQEEIDFAIGEIEQTLSGSGANIGIIFKGYFLKVLIVGILLQVFQQLVGINIMIYYAPTIFGYAGMKGFIAMMTVPTVNMLFTFPAIKLVEKWGRKKLLQIGGICMLITMLTTGFTFQYISGIKDPALIGVTPKIILLISSIIYIFGFAIGWGPCVWLVCSEIFPLKGREVGMTITTIINWTFTGILMANALTFMQVYGNASIFYLFACFTVISFFFVAFMVPETKGITLEELEANLRNGKKLRELGNCKR